MLFIAKICLLRVLKRFGYKSKLLAPWPYFLSFTDHLTTTFSSNASTRHLKKPGWDLKIFSYSATLTVTFLFKAIQITSCTETQSNCILSLSRLICITWFRRPQDQQFHRSLCHNKKRSHQLFWSIPTGAIRSWFNLCNHSAQEQKTIAKNHQNKKLQKNGRREI